jgi:hypothetical protein
MQCAAVRVGIDSHGCDAQLMARTNQAQCDLAAIGNQDLAKRSHQ